MSVIYCHRCDQIHDSDFIDCVQDPDQNTEMVCLESLTEEDRANASVLCASKDMYEALEAMLAAHRPGVSQDEMERAEFLAEAALSKARGELPEGEG